MNITTTSTKSKDDDSNAQVGEIADDRLDKDDDEEDDDNVPEDAVSLFKKLLSIKRKEVDTKSTEAETSNDELVITPTRILNGRQVSLIAFAFETALAVSSLDFDW